MTDGTLGEHGDVRGATTDVHQAHAQFLLVLGEHRIARGELFQDYVVHFQAATAHTLDDVLGRAHRAGDHVYLGLQAYAGHTHRLADAVLGIDDEFLGQDVQDLLVGGDGHGARRVDDPLHVAGGHFLVADSDDAMGIQAADMTAGDARVDRVDLAAGHQLGLFHGALNGMHRGFDIHHHTLLEAARGMGTDADDFHTALRRDLTDDGHHLGGADVESHDEVFFNLLGHGHSALFGPVARRPAYGEAVAVAQIHVLQTLLPAYHQAGVGAQKAPHPLPGIDTSQLHADPRIQGQLQGAARILAQPRHRQSGGGQQLLQLLVLGQQRRFASLRSLQARQGFLYLATGGIKALAARVQQRAVAPARHG